MRRPLRLFGGTYMADCSNPAAPRATVFADALVVLHGDKRIAGDDVQNAVSQGVVYGKIFERGKSTLIGSPPPPVTSELDRLWRSEWRQK